MRREKKDAKESFQNKKYWEPYTDIIDACWDEDIMYGYAVYNTAPLLGDNVAREWMDGSSKLDVGMEHRRGEWGKWHRELIWHHWMVETQRALAARCNGVCEGVVGCGGGIPDGVHEQNICKEGCLEVCLICFRA